MTGKLKDLLIRYRRAGVFNPWSEVDPLDRSPDAPEERWDRLERHFDCEPRILLVGEAPSWRGQRFGGISFCSERLLHDGAIPRVPSLGNRITTLDKPITEMSATVVWRQLYQLGLEDETVCWNAFAWHPHKADQSNTNRRPTTTELLDSLPVLMQVIRLFPSAQVISVGQVAADSLDKLRVFTSGRIRHPAFGGAKQFADDLTRLTQGWISPFSDRAISCD